VRALSVRATFPLVVSPELNDTTFRTELRAAVASRNTSAAHEDAEAVEDAVFLGGFMPQSLRELDCAEREVAPRAPAGRLSLCAGRQTRNKKTKRGG